MNILKAKFMRALALVGAAFFSCTAFAADHVSVAGTTGGQVLNCFGWKYTTIKQQLSSIKKANFTAVQVSSVQPLPTATDFDGKYNFTDPQSTPVPDWYRIYAPLSLKVISTSDNADNTPLGTRTELEALITAAHSAGIAVIAGVEANQLWTGATLAGAGSDASGNAVTITVRAYDSNHTFNFNDPTRHSFTNWAINAAVSDIQYCSTSKGGTATEAQATANITAVKQLVTSLYDLGIDGIAWYHGKYIPLLYGYGYSGTGYDMGSNTTLKDDNGKTLTTSSSDADRQVEGSEFWPTIWGYMSGDNVKMYSYVNLNLDPYTKGERFNPNTGLDHDPTYFATDTPDDHQFFRALREYTKYGRVADAWYAKSSIMQDGVSFASGYWVDKQAPVKYYQGFKNTDVGNKFYAAVSTDMVYLAEDENTYMVNPEVMYEPMTKTTQSHENRPSDRYGADVMDRAYADMASHDGVTAMYFARPFMLNGKASFKLGDDLSQLVNYSYCYFDDAQDWVTGTNKLTVTAAGDGVTAATDASTEVTLAGTSNGHKVYLWRFMGTGTPTTVKFTCLKENGDTVNTTKAMTYEQGGFYNAMQIVKPEGSLPSITFDGSNSNDSLTVYVYVTNTEAAHVYVNAWKDGGGGFNNMPKPGWEAKNTVTGSDGRIWRYVRVPRNIWNGTLYQDGIQLLGYKAGTDENTAGDKLGETPGEQNILTSDDVWIEYNGSDFMQNALASTPAFCNEAVRYQSTPVKEVNEYHKLMNGEREYKEAFYNADGKNANIASICRQHGAVIVMRAPDTHSGIHNSSNAAMRMQTAADGQPYTDAITGSAYTVTGNGLNGMIGNSGIAVVYNKTQMESMPYAISPSYGTAAGSMEIKMTATDANYTVQYCYSNNIEFKGKTEHVSTDYKNSKGNYVYNPPSKWYHHRAYNADWSDVTTYAVSSTGTTLKISYDDYYDDNGTKVDGLYDYSVSKSGRRVSKSKVPLATVYVQMRAVNKTTGAVVLSPVHSFNLYATKNSGRIYSHVLMFHFPEGVDPHKVRIDAWNDNGGQILPLTPLGGDTLAAVPLNDDGTMVTNEEQLEDAEKYKRAKFVRPVDKMYEPKTNTSGTVSSNGESAYLSMCGSNAATYIDYDGTGYKSVASYDRGKGISFNDVTFRGATRISRYTVGLPGIHLDDVKFRLSYEHPYGYTQQLEVMALNGSEDGFYSVRVDDERNLSIGPEIFMVGDAIYDNNNTKYITRGQYALTRGFDAETTQLDYDPNESRRLSVGNKHVEVFTYSGEFIHGKNFRFGTPFDFQTNYVEEDTTANTPFKVFLRPVEKVANIAVSASSTWSMDVGGYDAVYDGSSNTKDQSINSFWTLGSDAPNLTWTLPSGYYTLSLYREIMDKDTTVYYTVTRPTIKFNNPNGSSVEKITEDTRKVYSTPVNMDMPNGYNTTDSNSDLYFQTDIPHVGQAGYRGAKIVIDTNNPNASSAFKLDPFILEGQDASSANSNVTDYASLYPETGRYRVIYHMGHSNETAVSGKSYTGPLTAAQVNALTEQQKAERAANMTAPTAEYMLGFACKYYTKDELEATDLKGNDLSGCWTSYSDGLPRLKPKGLTAYFVSGYTRKEGETDPSAFFLTELKSDTLPANTGLILRYSFDLNTESNNTNSEHFDYKEGGTNWIYLTPISSTKEYVIHQAGTNFAQPYIACDPTVTATKDNKWLQPANTRTGSNYKNYWLSIGPRTGKASFNGVGYKKQNYELRKCFISIPDDDSTNGSASGDVTFSAKPRMASASDGTKYEVVRTAPVDVVFGDDHGTATGIRGVTVDGQTDKTVYNLSGQRVSNPHQGVYIIGGKKVIVK